MKFIYTSLFLLCTISLFSQSNKINKCDHDEWLEAKEKTTPGYTQKIKDSFNAFKNNKKSNKRNTITIPVHVIIVHPAGQPIGTGSNHSLAHVQSQIDVLNQDFGQYNSDSGNTPPEFPAGDTGIQFCLATVDPNGGATDGITRYAFDGAFHPNASAIREETRWPRETYSNIWSAPNLPYLGLASVPSQFSLPAPNNDFIHVDAATFGGPGFGTFPNYNLGRTATHEMGHYLGLFHIWANDGCGTDDGIDDTPIQDNENFGCPSHPSPSCTNSGDMFMNYMDYVNDNCMNAFSEGQGEYMCTILSTSRASLSGASFTACATVVPLTLAVISQEDPSCTDSDDGFILVEASGGTPNYTYSINGSVPGSNNLFTDLPGGNYIVEAFDNDGNSAVKSVFLNTPLPLTATINITQTNNCPNEMNGAIQIQVAGGSNPYMYALNMGMAQQSGTFEDLSNGTYAVNIEDGNGCTYEDVFELTGDTEITITIDSTANLICGNDNMGLIIASAEGGTGPLSYSINGFEYQDTGEFLELDGGTYFVYVQDSVGCYDSLEVLITEPDPFFLSINAFDATCFGYNDGYVDFMAFGGNGAPYQFSFDSITYGDTTMLDSLFAGAYDLYALDSLGCLAIATFDIEEPDEILVMADTIIHVACFGGSDGMLSLSTTGGNGGYSFIIEGDTTTTGEFSNLEVGTYAVTVIDVNGCVGEATFEIGLISTLSLSVAGTQMPSCFGGSDGTIEVETENNEGDKMYSIDGGPLQESAIFVGLAAGDYLIEVVDSTGCTASVDVSLGEPDLIALQIAPVNVSCNGAGDGSVSVVVTGGTAPYQYNYTPSIPGAPGDYAVEVIDMNGCTATGNFTVTEPYVLELNILTQGEVDCETGAGALVELGASGGTEGYNYTISGSSGTTSNEDGVFDDLQIGEYQASVTDVNGCEVAVDIFITLENMFSAELTSVADLLCFGDMGGALALNVEGGMGNITYLLDGATEVDPAMLNASAGDHTITVVDENDCMIEIPFTLTEPDELVIDSVDLDFDQFTLTVYVSGGVGPYMYSFNGADFTDSNVTDELGASIVTVAIKDANGCEIESSIGIDGVNDLAEDWGVHAYPNPFQEELILELDFPNQIEASIEVFDISGRLVYNISAKKYNTGNNFVKIDLRNFASSIYIVKIASADGYRFMKATKM